MQDIAAKQFGNIEIPDTNSMYRKSDLQNYQHGQLQGLVRIRVYTEFQELKGGRSQK